eukprot:8272544-Prorocentrum_lima.AAC.1
MLKCRCGERLATPAARFATRPSQCFATHAEKQATRNIDHTHNTHNIEPCTMEDGSSVSGRTR